MKCFRKSIGRVAIVVATVCAGLVLAASGALPAWMVNVESKSALEGVFFRLMDMPGGAVLGRRPPAETRTALERHRVAQEQIAAEEERARAALADAARRLGQLRQDLAHAEQLRHDSETAESRLAAEDATLAEADSGQADRLLLL